MKYSLRELFEVIDEKKSELEYYYYENEREWGADFYIDDITYFEPNNEYKIINGWHLNIIKAWDGDEKVKNLDKDLKQIDVSGILVYVSTPQYPASFEIFRAKDIKDAEEYMYSGAGISTDFTEDIVVLENGKRKKFFIKDFKGNILKYCWYNELEDEETEKPLFTIEWEN